MTDEVSDLKYATKEEIDNFSPAEMAVLAEEYWHGGKNVLVRYYLYAQRGLSLINDFKYLGAGIFGLYILAKFTNPIWILLMTAVSLPPLIILGRWQLYRVSRIGEWVSRQFGTVLGYNEYNMYVKQTELQKKILDKLDEISKKL